ncbi:alpha/beta hydrolase [Candidatus Roizmanbacteria bacterium]|nr:alpha/beta hydrolase [Candidatus Roizmanbacteria bacterium]
MEIKQKIVISKDGTTIAYEQSGFGSALIIVSAALADHSGTTKLANLLAEKFTVINYDRRGRGKSSDTKPYAVEYEVEDIAALIEAVGGKAYLFGSSSGAALALEAASKLGAKVKGLFMYEPPFIIDSSRPPMASDLITKISQLVAAGKDNDAVKLFFIKGMGIPAFGVTMMRFLMPGWSKMAKIAHTIPYDLAILDGTQSGKPLPAKRWATLTSPALVMVGSRSEAFFHSGAKALVELLPSVKYKSLEGGSHASVLMMPKLLAIAISTFFLNNK